MLMVFFSKYTEQNFCFMGNIFSVSSNSYYIKGVLRGQSNIYDGAFDKNGWRLLDVDYFCTKAPSLMFDSILNFSLIMMQWFFQPEFASWELRWKGRHELSHSFFNKDFHYTNIIIQTSILSDSFKICRKRQIRYCCTVLTRTKEFQGRKKR